MLPPLNLTHRLVGSLGGGAFGRVSAWEPLQEGDPWLAVKYLLPHRPQKELEKNFKTETEALERLQHPNVVKNLGFDKYQDVEGRWKYEIRMEYCAKGSLKEFLVDSAVVYNMKKVFYWAEQLFNVLLYLRDENVAHRDIKPANIMVTEHFDLMLGDFGLVREIDPAAKSTLTHTGTKLYMPPEISKSIRPRPDERKFDILMKSDLYSMGLVLWEIIERRQICFASAWDCWDRLVEDLWSDAFVLPLAECDHEIKLLIQMCVDAKYYRRPTTEEAYKTIREMNDRFVSTAICFENNSRNTLIRPLGFDGTMTEVPVSDSYLSFYDIYHWNEPKYRENRIEQFIAQLDSLPRNFHELEIFSKIYQMLSPEDFLNNHLPELCKTVLKKEILQFIEAQRLFLYPYTFYIDETPAFQEFSIPGKLLQSLINETVLVSDKKIQKTVLEREWRALILYLWTQSLLMEDSFKKLHQKLATFFSGEILDLEHREYVEWILNHNFSLENSALYRFYSRSFFSFKLYRVIDKPNEQWIQLSRKENRFMEIDLKDPYPFKGDRNVHGNKKQQGEMFELTISHLEMEQIGVICINPTVCLIPPINARLDPRHPFRGTFFIESPLPLNTYIFQLSVSPIGSKERLYSQLTARELLNYNSAHAWFTARLKSEAPKTNLPETIGFSCFYFFRTKQIKDKSFSRSKRYLIFDLPTNGQQVLCLDLSTKRLLKRYIRNDDIDDERFVLMQFDELLEILRKNESLENKDDRENVKEPYYYTIRPLVEVPPCVIVMPKDDGVEANPRKHNPTYDSIEITYTGQNGMARGEI